MKSSTSYCIRKRILITFHQGRNDKHRRTTLKIQRQESCNTTHVSYTITHTATHSTILEIQTTIPISLYTLRSSLPPSCLPKSCQHSNLPKLFSNISIKPYLQYEIAIVLEKLIKKPTVSPKIYVLPWTTSIYNCDFIIKAVIQNPLQNN